MIAELQLASQLEQLDRKIAEVQREITELPKQIARIEKTLETHNRRLEADRAALLANQKDRRRLEDDIKVHQQKVSKLRDQMLQAKTNEQYRAFQNEIDYAEREVRKAEDRILDLMGESEPLEANVKKAEGALEQEKKQVEAEKKRARDATKRDQDKFAQLQTERKEIAGQLKPDVYTAYERIRKKRGHAVAEVVDGRCSACQIVLRPQYFQDLKHADQLLFCESCGRILFYNPHVLVEE